MRRQGMAAVGMGQGEAARRRFNTGLRPACNRAAEWHRTCVICNLLHQSSMPLECSLLLSSAGYGTAVHAEPAEPSEPSEQDGYLSPQQGCARLAGLGGSALHWGSAKRLRVAAGSGVQGQPYEPPLAVQQQHVQQLPMATQRSLALQGAAQPPQLHLGAQGGWHEHLTQHTPPPGLGSTEQLPLPQQPSAYRPQPQYYQQQEYQRHQQEQYELLASDPAGMTSMTDMELQLHAPLVSGRHDVHQLQQHGLHGSMRPAPPDPGLLAGSNPAGMLGGHLSSQLVRRGGPKMEWDPRYEPHVAMTDMVGGHACADGCVLCCRR